jgi:hypothetical protein
MGRRTTRNPAAKVLDDDYWVSRAEQKLGESTVLLAFDGRTQIEANGVRLLL